jgi:hypothetical protein
VIIQDGVELTWSSILDIESYSIRIKQEDMTRIPEILQAVSAEQIAKMQANLANVWRRCASAVRRGAAGPGLQGCCMHCSRLEGRCGGAVKSCVLRCTCRHLWTGLRPYKDAVSKLLEQRKEATAKEPVKSQPAPLLDYDPAEDDALSTLMQVGAAGCLMCCACCAVPAVLCLLCPGGSMSTLTQMRLFS